MKRYFYDLHLHSCLSPCGDDEMTPGNLVSMAQLLGLDVIALTDHNSCKNCPAAMKWGKELGVLVIPGMELTTDEDVHVVCLFPTLEAAQNFECEIDKTRTRVPNKIDIFGHQSVVDGEDNIIEEVPYLLTPSSGIPVFSVAETVAKFGGACYPAHIDRDSYSVITTLGFITADMGFHAVEFSKNALENGAAQRLSGLYPPDMYIVSSSDAHYLPDINERVNSFGLAELTAACVLDKFK